MLNILYDKIIIFINYQSWCHQYFLSYKIKSPSLPELISTGNILLTLLFLFLPQLRFKWHFTEPQRRSQNPRDPEFCSWRQQWQRLRFSCCSPRFFPPPSRKPTSYSDDNNSPSKSTSIGAPASTAPENTADLARAWATRNPASAAPSKKPSSSAGIITFTIALSLTLQASFIVLSLTHKS